MAKSESTHEVAEQSETEPDLKEEAPAADQDVTPRPAPGTPAGGPPKQIKPDGR